MQKISLLFFLFIHSAGTFSQSPKMKNYSVAEGLPSSETYMVYQDSWGYLWITSDQGISRFDGYEFKNFDSRDGVSGTVLRFYEDTKKRLWFNTFPGQFGYIFKDKMHSIKANNKLPDMLKSALTSTFYVDEGDTLWSGLILGQGIVKIYNNFSEAYYDSSAMSQTTIITADPKRIIFSYDSRQNQENTIAVNWKHQASVKIPILYKSKNLSPVTPTIALRNGKVLHYNNGVLYLINKKGIESSNKIDHVIISLYEDANNNIWLGTRHAGVLFYEKGNLNEKPVKFLDQHSISSILEDKEGGLWFSTLEKGIYYLYSKDILNYTQENGLSDNKVLSLKAINKKKIVIGLKDGKINIIEDQKVKEIDVDFGDVIDNSIYDILVHSDSSLWVGGSFGQVVLNKNFSKQERIDKFLSKLKGYTVKASCESKDGSVWVCSFNSLLKIKKEKNEFRVHAVPLDKRPFSILEDRNGRVWIGTLTGLLCFSDSQLVDYSAKKNLLSRRINDIKEDPRGNIWMATAEDGILILKDGKVTQINISHGLPSNSCKTLFIDKDEIWIGSAKGLSRIKGDFNNYTIENFSSSKGFITNEINEIVKVDNNLWLGTNQGLTVVNSDKLKINAVPPPVFINKVSVLNREVELNSFYKLNYDHNFIQINFSGLSFKDAGKMTYKYKLVGIDKNWNYTSATSAHYTTLPPGRYTFEVYAKNSDNIYSSVPAVASFIITPPVWGTWWFRIGAVLFVILSIVFLFRYRLHILRTREREKTEISKRMADIHLKALRAQINPHFIFNSMNSIQYFILNNYKEAAQKYLTKFSRLMRSVLENSELNYIPLSQEINALQLYLELEHLRFENKFEYEILIANNIDVLTVQIPSMLIQPFVENSIWHGLMHKSSTGKISIDFSLLGNILKCTITDNGVGRKKAAEINTLKTSHRSLGMHVTKERLEIINAQKVKNDLSIKITDLYDNGEPAGTRVELYVLLSDQLIKN